MEDAEDIYLNHELDGIYLSVGFVSKQGCSYRVLYSGGDVEASCRALDCISSRLITGNLAFRLVSSDLSALPFDKLKGIEKSGELDKWLKLYKIL